MIRYLLALFSSLILGLPLGSMLVRAQSSPQSHDFCASLPSFPCHNQTSHQQGAIAAIDISYPHEVDSNVQIFETPDWARQTFDRERSAGDLDLLGTSQPTSEVGDFGYGYKRNGSLRQTTSKLVEYDFVRSCYRVNLNNANGAISSADGYIEYSSESNEFAVKFAQKLDKKLKETLCPSTARVANGSDRPGGHYIGGLTSSSLTMTREVVGGIVLAGLGLLLFNKLWGWPARVRTSTGRVETSRATRTLESIPHGPAAPQMESAAPAQGTRDYPSPESDSIPERLSSPKSIDEIASIESPLAVLGFVSHGPTAPQMESAALAQGTRDYLSPESNLVPEQLKSLHPVNEPAQPGAAATTMPVTASWARILIGQLASTAIVLLLLIIGVFEFGGRSSVILSANSEASMKSRMGLNLERMGGDWRLSWNPYAPIILNAKKGHLSITDGDSRKLLDLDSPDLRGGTIMYTPLTNDVVWRLEVDRPDSGETLSESVRIAGGQLSPLVPQVVSPAYADTLKDIGSKSGDSGARPDLSKQADRLPPIKVSRSLRTGASILGDVNQDLTKSVPLTRTEPRNRLSSSLGLPLQPGSASKVDAVSLGLLSVLPTATGPAPPMTHVEPAQLILRNEPIYPALAVRTRVSGTIELRFYIRADGTVHDVSVVKGSPVLARAAAEAVQTWRYEPARLNGTSIESEGRAVLDFHPPE